MPEFWDVQGTPTFTVKVNGTRINQDMARMIEAVSCKYSHDAADSISLTIKDPELRFADEKVFAEGNFIDLWMGYNHRNHYMGRGIFFEPPGGSAPASGDCQINVTAHSAARRMMEHGKKKGGRRFGGYRDRRHDKEIIELLAKDYGFKPQAVETIQKRKGFKAQGMSDWEFARRLANFDGYRVWVEWIPENLTADNRGDVSQGQWNLCFLPPGLQPWRPSPLEPKSYEFVWGTTIPKRGNRLLDFSWSFAAGGGASEVEVLRFDRKTYNYARYIARLDTEGKPYVFHGPDARELIKDEIKTGARVVATVFGKQVHVIRDKPFANEQEALDFAKTFLERISTSFVHLEGTIPGLPDVRKYSRQKFKGIPARLKGEYELMDVEHTMSRTGGYMIRFSGRRAPEGLLDMSVDRV